MRALRSPRGVVLLLSAGLCLALLFETKTPTFTPRMIELPSVEVRLGARSDESLRHYVLPAIAVSRYEITTLQFARYLNETKLAFDPEHPSVKWAHGRWVPRVDRFHPMTGVTGQEANGYAQWLGEGFRLPYVDEWEAFARGGLDGAPFPWGWGLRKGRANWGSASAGRVGQYAANGYGLYDVAGNVFEFAVDGDQLLLCGGAWSERSESMLKVFKRSAVEADYADRDAGFRVVRRLD